MIIGMIALKKIPQKINQIMLINHIDATIADFISTIIRYIIIIIIIIILLEYIGIKSTSILAIVGGAGLTIGLAIQNSLSNFAAGILLVSFRYFRKGDYIDCNNITGTVLAIQVFATTLCTLDGKIVIIPNNKVLSSNIINYSKEPNRLIEIIISVKDDNDIENIKQLLLDISSSYQNILTEKGIIIYLKSLENSLLNFNLRVWTPYSALQKTTFNLIEKIKQTFDNNHIIISSIYTNINIKLI